MAYKYKSDEIRKCELCGTEFVPRMHHQKYCCNKCQIKAKTQEEAIKTAQRKSPKNISLGITNQLAKNAGMSYGQYQAMKWMKEREKHDAS